VARQFRTALAYRRQAEESDRAEARSQVAGVGIAGQLSAVDERVADRQGIPPAQAPHDSIAPNRTGFSESQYMARRSSAPPPGGYPTTEYPSTEQPLDHLPPDLQQIPLSRGSLDARNREIEPPRDVVPAGYDSDSSGAWRASLDDAIRALESQVKRTPQSDTDVAEHLRLRMLRLLAGRRDEALEPLPDGDSSLQDFWGKQLFGLGTILDTKTITDAATRTAEAQRHLAEAMVELGESAPLVVRNLAFVTAVENYGSFTPFDKYEFRPNERVILYAEIENFKSSQTEQGYHTALKSSYQIFDSQGRRVTDHDFATNDEYCRNPRRDFFIGYEFSMPKRIYPGRHILKLTVVDLNSQKIGQSSIEFTIVDVDE
jgi:hypothetical protein